MQTNGGIRSAQWLPSAHSYARTGSHEILPHQWLYAIHGAPPLQLPVHHNHFPSICCSGSDSTQGWVKNHLIINPVSHGIFRRRPVPCPKARLLTHPGQSPPKAFLPEAANLRQNIYCPQSMLHYCRCFKIMNFDRSLTFPPPFPSLIQEEVSPPTVKLPFMH